MQYEQLSSNVKTCCFSYNFILQFCTILVLNYHHRLASNGAMPALIQKVFLQWLPWLLRMSRNGEKITKKSIDLQNKV